MKEKSILEQALLQVETLEEAVKANAKGIIASTMKQELNELLKESLEDEDEVTGDEPDTDTPGEDANDMSDVPTATDDNDDTETLDNPPAVTDTEDEVSDDDFGPEEGSEEDEVLDMTNAPHDEVLKVFRAMKPEDGIVVKKDGNTIEVSTGDDDFIIKLDDEESTDELPTDDFSGMGDTDVDDTDMGVGDTDVDDTDVEDTDVEDTDVEDTDVEDTDVEDTDSEESDDTEDDDDQLAESDKSKPFGAGNKKAGKNGPFTGGKKAGKNGPYTGGKKEVKEGDELESEVKEDSKPFGTGTKKAGKNGPFTGGKKAGKNGPYTGKAKEVKEGDSEETVYEIELDDKEGEQTESARTIGNGYHAGIKSKTKWKAGNKREEVNEEVAKLKKQNEEYKKAMELFKESLNKVAVFNAGLAYSTRLIIENTTTKQEKMNILGRFDSCSTIGEAKALFETIKAELETKKPVTETVINKITSTPSTSSSTEVLSESKAYENPQFKRMKDLMNKIK